MMILSLCFFPVDEDFPFRTVFQKDTVAAYDDLVTSVFSIFPPHHGGSYVKEVCKKAPGLPGALEEAVFIFCTRIWGRHRSHSVQFRTRGIGRFCSLL